MARSVIPYAFTVVLCLAAPAHAQDTAPASPLEGIYACAGIADSVERLACFDSKVALVRQREEAREFVAIDRETAEGIEEESFGFNMPSIPKLALPRLGDGGKATQGQDSVMLVVDKVTTSGRDIVVMMENGQVWREVGGKLNYIPRGDLTAEIKKAALGSYRLSLSNGKERVRGLRVRRVK